MSLPFLSLSQKVRIDQALPTLNFRLAESFRTSSVLKFQTRLSKRLLIYPRNSRKTRSSERRFIALLSYVSIADARAGLLSKTKKCELCGSDFECKGLLGCWCRSVDISREQQSELFEKASDCICPNCLAKVQRYSLTLLNLSCRFD